MRVGSGLMPLVVCATPIGNLEDVTLRVLASFARRTPCSARTPAARGSCSTGTGSGLAASSASIATTRLRGRRSCCRGSLAGETLALVSDAGLPGVNDPGSRLVVAALAAGVPVTVLPGRERRGDGARRERARQRRSTASSATCRGARRELRALWDEARGVALRRGRVRVAATAARRALEELARASPTRQVAVCRELTKRFEEVVRGTAAELAERFREPVKGEVTRRDRRREPSPARSDRRAAVAAVRELVDAGASRRVAVDVVARLAGASRNELYRSSLAPQD